MLRNLGIGLAGLLLTGILLVGLGWLTLNFSQQGALVRAHLAGTISDKDFAEEFLRNAEHSLLINDAVAMPLIAVVAGCFAGLFARQRPWLLSLIALIPVFLFYLLRPNVKQVALCAAYAAIAVVTATALSHFRKKRRLQTSPTFIK